MKIIHLSISWVLVTSGALAQNDDFDDNDTVGWTSYDPISQQTGGTHFTASASGGAVRLTAGVSPAQALGPGRGALLRQDVIYNDSFYLSVDVTAYDLTQEQAFGFLALVQPNPTIGTTNGYSFTYQPVSNDIQISRVENEAPIEVSTDVDLAAPIDPNKTYRLVFWGFGGNMEARIYVLDDLETPLAVATGFDTTHTSGTCGLVVFDNTASASGSADATFDNYVANDGSLPNVELVMLGGGEYRVQYPDWLVNVDLELSTTLTAGSWSVIPPNVLAYFDGNVSVAGEFVLAPQHYYRLRRP